VSLACSGDSRIADSLHRLNHTEPEYGITCKHGPSECLLNIQELCIMDYYPLKQWWPFVMYVNNAENPNEAAKGCAGENGIDWVLVEGCMIGKGRGLLMESVAETKELGITSVSRGSGTDEG